MKTFEHLINDCLNYYTSAEMIPSDACYGISIVKGEETLFQKMQGRVSVNGEFEAVNAETKFPLVSLSKTFTGLAMLTLQQQQKLTIDDPVNHKKQYLRLKDHRLEKTITFSDVLSHTSGVPAHDLLWYLTNYSNEQLIGALAQLDFHPEDFRNEFNYNNILYSLLASVFEDYSGESLDSFFAREIFTPMGLQTTAFIEPKDPAKNNSLIDYSNPIMKRMEALKTASGLVSNMSDLSRYMIYLNNLKKDQSGLADRLLSRKVDIKAKNPLLFNGLEWIEDAGYGLGWFHGSYGNHPLIFHMGLIDGYTNLLAILSGENMGFAMISTLNYSPLPGLILKSVADHLWQPEKTHDAAVVSGNDQPSTEEPGKAVDMPARLEGIYHNSGYGELFITEENDRHRISYFDHSWNLRFESAQGAYFLLPVGPMQLTMPLFFDDNADSVDTVSIPFALDPRVPAIKFIRK